MMLLKTKKPEINTQKPFPTKNKNKNKKRNDEQHKHGTQLDKEKCN